MVALSLLLPPALVHEQDGANPTLMIVAACWNRRNGLARQSAKELLIKFVRIQGSRSPVEIWLRFSEHP